MDLYVRFYQIIFINKDLRVHDECASSTTTTSYPVKSHKVESEKGVRSPYHYLYEIEKLFLKDHRLKKITAAIKRKKIVGRNMKTNSKAVRCIYARNRNNQV